MKFIAFLNKYRLPITFGVPLLFVLVMLILIFPSGGIDQAPSPNADVNQNPASFPINPTNNLDNPTEGNEEDLENRPGLQKKESLSDGTTKNYFSSPVANRPNIIIEKGEEEILFQSSVTDPSFPVKVTDYLDSYGVPQWVFKGSVFYGTQAQTYIYPDLGFAFIANPQTGDVLEQHVFEPILIEDYIKKYGADIINLTPVP